MVPLLLFLILLALAWPIFLLFGLSLNANIGAITVIISVLYVYLAWKQRGKVSGATAVDPAAQTEPTKAEDRIKPN